MHPRDRALMELREAAADIAAKANEAMGALQTVVNEANAFEEKADALDVEYAVEEQDYAAEADPEDGDLFPMSDDEFPNPDPVEESEEV